MTEEQKVKKWMWQMEWCRNRGHDPSRPDNWEAAEHAWGESCDSRVNHKEICDPPEAESETQDAEPSAQLIEKYRRPIKRVSPVVIDWHKQAIYLGGQVDKWKVRAEKAEKELETERLMRGVVSIKD